MALPKHRAPRLASRPPVPACRGEASASPRGSATSSRTALAPPAGPGDAAERPICTAVAREGTELDAFAVELESGADHAGAAEAQILAESGGGAAGSGGLGDLVHEALDPLDARGLLVDSLEGVE